MVVVVVGVFECVVVVVGSQFACQPSKWLSCFLR